MKAAAAQYRANTDTVVAWGQEQLEWEHRARLQLGEAFLRYEVWCDTNNRRALGLQRFKAHVLQTFPRIRLSKSKGYPVLVGAQFRRDPDSSVKDEVITSRRRRGGEP